MKWYVTVAICLVSFGLSSLSIAADNKHDSDGKGGGRYTNAFSKYDELSKNIKTLVSPTSSATKDGEFHKVSLDEVKATKLSTLVNQLKTYRQKQEAECKADSSVLYLGKLMDECITQFASDVTASVTYGLKEIVGYTAPMAFCRDKIDGYYVTKASKISGGVLSGPDRSAKQWVSEMFANLFGGLKVDASDYASGVTFPMKPFEDHAGEMSRTLESMGSASFCKFESSSRESSEVRERDRDNKNNDDEDELGLADDKEKKETAAEKEAREKKEAAAKEEAKKKEADAAAAKNQQLATGVPSSGAGGAYGPSSVPNGGYGQPYGGEGSGLDIAKFLPLIQGLQAAQQDQPLQIPPGQNAAPADNAQPAQQGQPAPPITPPQNNAQPAQPEPQQQYPQEAQNDQYPPPNMPIQRDDMNRPLLLPTPPPPPQATPAVLSDADRAKLMDASVNKATSEALAKMGIPQNGMMPGQMPMMPGQVYPPGYRQPGFTDPYGYPMQAAPTSTGYFGRNAQRLLSATRRVGSSILSGTSRILRSAGSLIGTTTGVVRGSPGAPSAARRAR